MNKKENVGDIRPFQNFPAVPRIRTAFQIIYAMLDNQDEFHFSNESLEKCKTAQLWRDQVRLPRDQAAQYRHRYALRGSGESEHVGSSRSLKERRSTYSAMKRMSYFTNLSKKV